MNKEKINQIYEIILKGLKLTRETLNIYNFNEEEINELVNDGILKAEDNDNYSLASIEGFYRYGVKLLLNKQQRKAEACFRICNSIEPNNREVLLQLLLMSLTNRNYTTTEKMFASIEKIDVEEYQEDNKLYLYMLSLILFRNPIYRERLNNIKIEEMLIPKEKEHKNKEMQNKIREMLIKKKYKYALKLINDLKRKDFIYSSELELLKELTLQVIELENKFKISIRNALTRKDYIRILELLETKSQNQYLNNMETYIKIVTNAIIELKATQTIPVITMYSTNLLYEALKGNNFKLARAINKDFLIETKQNVEEDILNALLNNLINLIEELEEKEFAIQFNVEKLTNIILPESNQIKYNTNELSLDLSQEEEFAYYIKELKIDLETAKKKLGLFEEEILLIKLIYARDYYIDGLFEEGDKIVCEVECSNTKTDKISQFLSEIKNNKENYSKNKNNLIRRRKI